MPLCSYAALFVPPSVVVLRMLSLAAGLPVFCLAWVPVCVTACLLASPFRLLGTCCFLFCSRLPFCRQLGVFPFQCVPSDTRLWVTLSLPFRSHVVLPACLCCHAMTVPSRMPRLHVSSHAYALFILPLGPLGQGISNCVGLAIGAHHLAAKFNKPNFDLFNNFIYCICGDGCLQEG